MIAWDTKAHSYKNIVYLLRQRKAQLSYFDHPGFRKGRFGIPKPALIKGYQSQISSLYNSCKGKPAVVVCNGPSLNHTPLDFICNSVSIGCNGIYKQFPRWGFSTNYLVYEDVEQFEIRAKELRSVKGPQKMASIYNAYALSDLSDWIFFNCPRNANNSYYWDENELYPQFSVDFASVVHLGSTVTYIMLQLAFFLGCDPVYIVGLDFSYGQLSELFPPGKIRITSDNIDVVRRCHVNPDYYKLGDVIGVPWMAKQKLAYAKAYEVFSSHGRSLFNASFETQLDVIPRFKV
jgi:hypothetical protein